MTTNVRGYLCCLLAKTLYYIILRNWQKHERGRSQCFLMELDDKKFCVGLLAPKTKYNQLFRLIG